MRYDPINPSLFIDNRTRFTALMEPNSIAIAASNDVMPNNADDVMAFAQNNDLFYLTGIEQEETILVLYPDALKPENRVVLFVRETNDHIKLWDGEKLTKEQAAKISGISNVKWTHEFEQTLQYMAFEADAFYLGHNEHAKRLTNEMQTRQDRMIAWCKQKYPLHEYKRLAKITRELRPVKSEVEVDLIKKAAAISIEGFSRVLKTVKPGCKEYELEAELTYTLVKHGATRHAFKPIIASGANACGLHYNTNDNVCKDGDMILVDFGVCYGNYNSDTTRCIPVNGKFSDRQRQVYSSVLHCLKEGSKLLQVGTMPADYEKEMAKLVEAELVKLGLLTWDAIQKQDPNKPLYKKYFMHGTAHYLGLDVHDIGLYSRAFEPGMVLTCEPGIYIPEENIGCRLEDDYLLTPEGSVNLTKDLPLEIEEIEALINA